MMLLHKLESADWDRIHKLIKSSTIRLFLFFILKPMKTNGMIELRPYNPDTNIGKHEVTSKNFPVAAVMVALSSALGYLLQRKPSLHGSSVQQVLPKAYFLKCLSSYIYIILF